MAVRVLAVCRREIPLPGTDHRYSANIKFSLAIQRPAFAKIRSIDRLDEREEILLDIPPLDRARGSACVRVVVLSFEGDGS